MNERNSDAFFQMKDANSSYLNQQYFVEVLERVYQIERCHSIVGASKSSTGVPAFKINTMLSGHKVSSMPFNFYPPLSGQKNAQAAVCQLISIAKEAGSKYYVEYKTQDLLPQTFVEEHALAKIPFSVTSELILQGSMNEQRRLYKNRHRTKVNRALRNEEGFEISTANDSKSLREWYDLLVRLYRDKHRMICQPFKLFQNLLQLKDCATLLIVKHNGEIIGGLFLLHDKNRWDYSWGAMKSGYEKTGANTLLLDSAIGHALNAGAKRFGFGSSSPSDEKLMFFKQRWGCEERMVYAYYWNHNPRPIDLNQNFGLARRVYSLLPIWMLKVVPNYIVPHLA